MNAYRKEAIATIGFFILYLLMAHTAPWVLIFGADNGARLLGFPLHYIAAIFLGWFGVLAVSIWWNVVADRLDEEIAAEDAMANMPDASPMPQMAARAEGSRP